MQICGNGVAIGTPCPTGEYCKFDTAGSCGQGDLPGACLTRPSTPASDYQPVCGCDGNPYPNIDRAAANGVDVAGLASCPVAIATGSGTGVAICGNSAPEAGQPREYLQTYDKSCTSAADCMAALIPQQCCSTVVVGVNRSETAGLAAGNILCRDDYLDPCDCAGDRRVTEEGQVSIPLADGGTPEILIDCVMSRCTARTLQSSCGDGVCSTGEICVHPPTSLGGPQPLCAAHPDGGVCPAGTQFAQCCGGQCGGGCIIPYVPPPPSCIAISGTCDAAIACSCLPDNICGGNANICQSVQGRDVYCINTAQ
jgi:hypothetical protein